MSFLNCYIDLSKKVFRPRIETEFWVEKAIQQISQLPVASRQLQILDIFAGSGCIGIAILKNIKNCRVDFVDISEEAIKQIKINLKLNKIPKKRCRVIQSDMFEKLEKEQYDIILANPPYVAENRISEVQKQVLEIEPRNALFAGNNGMDYIKKFLQEVKNHLKPNGLFFLEFDPLQQQEIKKILENQNFKFQFYKDQFHKSRWFKASA